MIITILINVAVVGFFVVREILSGSFKFEKIFLGDVKPWFIAFGVLCFGMALLAEYLKYKKMLMASAGKCDKRGAFEVAIIGKYTDNVTPFAAGGQPFQIHYLHKRGYSAGVSASVPVAGFLSQQIAFVIIGIIVFIFNHGLLKSLPLVNATAYIGLAFYMFVPAMILFFVVFPKPFRKLVGAVMRLLAKIRIVKNAEEKTESVCSVLDEYVQSIKMMNKRKFLTLKLIIMSLIYQVAIMSIPFFMLRAFGGTDTWWNIFCMTVYIYAAITIVPTPGNAGAAEGTFYEVFKILPGGLLFWAMMIWRVLVYYSWIIIGLFVVTRSAVTNKIKDKNPVPTGRPLKVALICDLFYPSVDGVVRTVDAYGREMVKAGHDVTIVCPKNKKLKNENYVYNIHQTSEIKLPFIPFSSALPFLTAKEKKYFKENTPDVIHVHSPFALGSLAVKIGRKFNIPVVASFHSKYYDDTINITHSKLIADIVTDKVVDFYSKVDKVWACSQSTAETLRSYGFSGDIDVMENGVEPMPDGETDDFKRAVADKYNIPDGKKILLFVGQQIWHKNLKLVIDVTNELSKISSDYVTVIAGHGYDQNDIKKYAKTTGADKNIVFTEEILDRKELFGLYSLADLFFFPSIYDNAPLVLREAALTGTPALLCEGTNAAEVVTDGVNGYTAENNVGAMTEKILQIFDSDNIESVGQRAKETIPVFWSEIASRVISKYRDSFPEEKGEE